MSSDDAPVMMSTSSAIYLKAQESERIRKKTEKFLKRGGKIEEVARVVVPEPEKKDHISKGKRKLKNNSDIFAGKDDA
jgi:hypothetical protein